MPRRDVLLNHSISTRLLQVVQAQQMRKVRVLRPFNFIYIINTIKYELIYVSLLLWNRKFVVFHQNTDVPEEGMME